MPNLLSGSLLRTGGSGEFIRLEDAQPQLPPTPTTSTGFTLVTDGLLRTSYRSSLGNIEFDQAGMWSNLTSGSIRIIRTGTDIVSTSTNSGLLVVTGDMGVGGRMNIQDDIRVNGLTVGQGFQGINNVVFRGTATAQVDAFENGQENIAIGYDVLMGIAQSYKSIGIGRYALSSGTKISNNIAIGDSALKEVGTVEYINLATITNVTTGAYVTIEITGATLATATWITIFDVVGTVELNGNQYYTSATSTSTYQLYSDIILSNPVTGTNFSAYVSSGTVRVNAHQDNNIALGVDAGKKLTNGRNNIFIGHESGDRIETGSYNIIIGDYKSPVNLTSGSGIISIGGDNLVDGVDDQVNIGSVFYYDGQGYAYISAETNVGLGRRAEIVSTGTFSSTSTLTGGLIVVGGAAVYDNLLVGTTFDILGTGTNTVGGTILPRTTSTVNLGASTATFNEVYALTGNPDENNLLYSPKVTVSDTAPTSARVGDVWIDPTVPAYLQYIKDGTSTFWIQVGAV